MKNILKFIDLISLIGIFAFTFDLLTFNKLFYIALLAYVFFRIVFFEIELFLAVNIDKKDLSDDFILLTTTSIGFLINKMYMNFNYINLITVIVLFILLIKVILNINFPYQKIFSLRNIIYVIFVYIIFLYFEDYLFEKSSKVFYNIKLNYFIFSYFYLAFVAFIYVFNIINICYNKFDFKFFFIFISTIILSTFFLKLRLNYCIEKKIIYRELISLNSYLLIFLNLNLVVIKSIIRKINRI